jgi:hypothetical protein
MNPAITRAALLLAALPAVLPFTSVHAQEMMRSGLWQFSAQGQMPTFPAGLSPPPGGQAQAGGTSFSSCIDPARSVPTDPTLACRVESMNRSGATVRWTMTCSVPQGAFRSEAVAQYRGGTMDGTLTTYIPMIGGQMTQRLTGRYLGPCTR